MSVPYTFATATSAIPLSQLDSNFATAITLGNTAMYLGNTTTSIGNLTLTNVTVTSGTINAAVSHSYSNANAVVYSNSSNVGTTSSTFFYDGTNLGIGTSSPVTKLQLIVAPTGTQDNGMRVTDGTRIIQTNITGSTYSYIGIGGSETMLYSSGNPLNIVSDGQPIKFIAGTAERMRIDSSGNVLIGTTSPAWNATGRHSLEVNGTSDALIGLRVNDGSNGYIYHDGTNMTFQNNSNGYEAFATNGTERMRIDSSGNVGIGTTSPSKLLHLYSTGNNAYTRYAYSGSGSYFEVGQGADSLAYVWNATNTAMLFGTNNTERMRIDSSGNVGIGTSSPGYRLGVVPGGSDGYAIRVFGASSTNAGYIQFTDNAASTEQGKIGVNGSSNLTFSTGGTERMRIDSGGSVLVGATATGAYFDGSLNVFKSGNIPMCVKIDTVSAWDISCWSTPTSGNNAFMNFGTEGTFTSRGSITYNRAGGLTAYNTTSDQRLKENIVDAKSALDKIDSVKIRSFDWKETGNHVDFGVIAQELQQVAPECVTEGQDNEDGTIKNPWAVDTSALVPAMIKAIQELKAEVDSLKAQLEDK